MSWARYGSLHWRSRLQHDLAAKLCPLNNLFFWSLILQLFHRNDDHFETTCHEQHLGWYLAVKLSPAHDFVIWSRILQIFHRNDHHIEMTCRPQHFGRYLEGRGHSMTWQQNWVWPINWLFEVRFYNYYTEMITLLGWHVARNIWVATLKIMVTAWPCSKIMSGSKLCYLKSHFETISQNWSTYWDAVSQAIFGSLPWPCRSRSQHDLASKCVRPITLLFEVWFYNYFTEMITILRWCVTTLPIVWLFAYYTALY